MNKPKPLRIGELFVDRKNCKLYQVIKRIELKGVIVCNPFDLTETTFVEFGRIVEKVDDVMKLQRKLLKEAKQ